MSKKSTLFEKIPFDKAIAAGVAYLTVLSICYNNGYWSTFYINIFNYYGLQDVLKGVIAPFFQFGALIMLPLLVIMLLVLLGGDKIDEETIPLLKINWQSKPRWMHIARKIFRVIGLLLLFCLIAGVIGLSLLIYPLEDQSQFFWIYLKSISGFSWLRLIVGIFVIPYYSAILVNELRLVYKGLSVRIATMASCLILTLFIAYHYGKADAYRIITGYEFLYFTPQKGKDVHKYLGKVNDFNFFLVNDYLISHRAISNFDIPIDINKVAFKPVISIVSDDSLKSIRLDSYSVNSFTSDTAMYKNFTLIFK